MAEIKKSFKFDDINNIDWDDKNIDWDEDRSGLGQKATKFYDNFEILYGTLTDLGSNKQNFIDKNLTSNLYPVGDVKSTVDNPDGYDGFVIENSDFKKAQEVVDYINTHNKYNEQLLKYEEKRSKYFGDRFYIYYPTNLRILWEFLNAKTRVQALGNPEEAIEFFIDNEDWAETDTEEIIKEKIESEFPDVKDPLLKKMVKYTNDLIADVYDIETEVEKEDKEFNHIQDFVWDYDWEKVNKNISTKKIEEIIKAKFPTISDKHLKWAIKETKDILDDIYFEENYKKGENRMITIEEAFKMLNEKPAKRIVEAKEEKECCPECGKCPCECDKSVNEDVEISSEEIKDFIAKVGAEAIEKALADFNGNAEEAPVEELPVEEPVETPEDIELELEEEPEEENSEENEKENSEETEKVEKETEEEVKEALNEENEDSEKADANEMPQDSDPAKTEDEPAAEAELDAALKAIDNFNVDEQLNEDKNFDMQIANMNHASSIPLDYLNQGWGYGTFYGDYAAKKSGFRNEKEAGEYARKHGTVAVATFDKKKGEYLIVDARNNAELTAGGRSLSSSSAVKDSNRKPVIDQNNYFVFNGCQDIFPSKEDAKAKIKKYVKANWSFFQKLFKAGKAESILGLKRVKGSRFYEDDYGKKFQYIPKQNKWKTISVSESLEDFKEGVGALLGGAAIAGAAAGLANGIVSKIGEGCEEEVNESVAESIPAIPLDANTVKDYIMNIPAPAPGRPPRFFKLGYIKELGSEIPAKFRGGRGSEGQPFVRIFKCTEYSALYTGNDWRNTDATRAADKVLGAERHTGEKTGFSYADEASANRIGTYADGSEALQAYIADHSRQRVKFFISLNDEDLHEVSREEVAQYFTPAQAAKLLAPVRPAAGVDAEGNNIYDKPINRFKLTNIYMIGNLGNSIM